MSIVPIVYRDWWEDCWDTPLRTSRLLDQHFGSGVTADDLLTALTSAAATCSALQQNCSRVRRNVSRQNSRSTVDSGTDKFQINLDVQQFSPDEISVKATDNSILVEAKHEEKQDEHGYISRHFVRRYVLPEGHNPEAIVSSLSTDGILTINVPKKALPEPEGFRTIPITQTGQPMKKITEKSEVNPDEKTSENGK